MVYPNRIRAIRNSQGFSLYRLAKLTGMSQPNLLRLETRIRSPRWETLERLARVLCCTIPELMSEVPPLEQNR
jgi:transcriptional regulator with XRE-family HTH domain